MPELDFPLRWTDAFDGTDLHPRWTGGYTNDSPEVTMKVAQGLSLTFTRGTEYASAAVVTRQPVLGDFDVRVRFFATNPQPGTALEIAAITVDPPRETVLGHPAPNEYGLSRAYDVHGAPPYVSSEYDEGDGWRVSWNRGPAISKVSAAGLPSLIADNHFNRYGPSSHKDKQEHPTVPRGGWLRLVRRGVHWATYRWDDADRQWIMTGEVRHMNMPDPVFLRLGAKHWVKRREGESAAPENTVTFHVIELRSQRPATEADVTEPASDDAQLIRELRGCRSCAGFTTENLYGPFPQAALKDGKIVIKGFSVPEPAALYGCRRAPIMLIGINPNLPSHFIFPRPTDKPDWKSGSYRLIPSFSSDKEYAFHYRQGPESATRLADPRDVESLLKVDSLVRATDSGCIAHTRSVRTRGRRSVQMVIQYKSGEEKVLNIDWKPEENLAVVRASFEKGDIIAGLMDAKVIGQTFSNIARQGELDKYYRHAGKLLEAVGVVVEGSSLKLGEDMSMHDAVACASPGWDAAEMPLDDIEHHCIMSQGWLHRQIMLSKPKVIVLSGQVALRLFTASKRSGTLLPALDELPKQAGGLDGLYFHSIKQEIHWRYRSKGATHTARVIIGPHFSYPDNFDPHAYYTASQWTEFKQRHSNAADWLTTSRLVQPVPFTEDTKIVDRKDAAQSLSQLETSFPEAYKEILGRWIEPFKNLGSGIASALDAIGVYPKREFEGHLDRNPQDCSFCRNELWALEGGCFYANDRG